MAAAVQELQTPRIKSTRPVASYKGKLRLGDAGAYDGAFAIDIERYPRTMKAKGPTASQFQVVKDEDKKDGDLEMAEAGDQAPGESLHAVRQSRTYQVKDEEGDEAIEIDKEDMEKGYKYGRTIVPISSTDETVTVLETEPALELIGFIPTQSVGSATASVWVVLMCTVQALPAYVDINLWRQHHHDRLGILLLDKPRHRIHICLVQRVNQRRGD